MKLIEIENSTQITELIKSTDAKNETWQIMAQQTHLSQDKIEQLAQEEPRKMNLMSLKNYSGINQYDPADMVVNVKSGSTLKFLKQELKLENQTLPFDADEQASIGSIIASGNSGHRQIFTSGLRAHILGLSLVNAQGKKLNFGGRVVKNVAGYDLSRLQIGAWGTLGVICEVYLKLNPIFQANSTYIFAVEDSSQAIEKMQQLLNQSLPITALSYYENKIFVRCEMAQGAKEQIEQMLKNQLGSFEENKQNQDFWNFQSWQKNIPLTDSQQIVKVHCSANTGSLANTVRIDWGGNIRWIVVEKNTLSEFHSELKQKIQGVYYVENQQEFIFAQLPQVVKEQSRRIKKIFDSKKLINSVLFIKMMGK